MLIKNLIEEDFVNYKKPSMFIGMPRCNFKCDKECGEEVCQNSDLALSPNIEIDSIDIVKRFFNNPITNAIVFGGLEPFDDFNDMHEIIKLIFIKSITDAEISNYPDVVIYTGYYPNEIKSKLEQLLPYCLELNIIIKFGRYIPNRQSKIDNLLGVELASDN